MHINYALAPMVISHHRWDFPTVGGIFLRYDVTSLTPYIGSSVFGFD
jgi:hypothetical protein